MHSTHKATNTGVLRLSSFGRRCAVTQLHHCGAQHSEFAKHFHLFAECSCPLALLIVPEQIDNELLRWLATIDTRYTIPLHWWRLSLAELLEVVTLVEFEVLVLHNPTSTSPASLDALAIQVTINTLVFTPCKSCRLVEMILLPQFPL